MSDQKRLRELAVEIDRDYDRYEPCPTSKAQELAEAVLALLGELDSAGGLVGEPQE